MKKKGFIGIQIGLVCLLAGACSSTGSIAVYNVNDTGTSPSGSYLYALPQTVIDIHVTIEETMIIPGPYQKYAEKYLGIKHAPAKTEKEYCILNIELSQHTEADPDHVYSAQGITDPDAIPGVARVLKEGLILSDADFSGFQVDHYTYPSKVDEIQYTDLSVKRNFEAEKDIEVSLVMPDTDYTGRPSTRTTLKEKSLEQKAEEAANFLIKLKKRRFKLVAGQYDYMPEGEAMADALNELARIEQEYLSLFIGKRIVNQLHRTYHYTPATAKENERVVLFRFSDNQGFLHARETSGIPVMLELNASKKIRGLHPYQLSLKPEGNILPYRIADQASLKVMVGEQLWAEAFIPVFQYGVVIPLNLLDR